MSHFPVIVFTETAAALDEAMLPFHEYECTDIDRYIEFVPATETQKEMYDTFEKNQDDYDSPDTFIEKYYGYMKNDDGFWGRMTNPNAKWDWWVIGGRWKGMLRTKSGNGTEGVPGVFKNESEPDTFDQCRVDDLNFDAMLTAQRASNERHWDAWEKKFLENCDKEKTVRDPIAALVTYRDGCNKLKPHDPELALLHDLCGDFYFMWAAEILEYADRQKYIDSAVALSAYAVLTDGKWHQRGEMGWWGISSDEVTPVEWDYQFNKLLKSAPGHHIITVVDCHI